MGAVDLFELACLEVGSYQYCRALQVISYEGSQMEEITDSIVTHPPVKTGGFLTPLEEVTTRAATVADAVLNRPLLLVKRHLLDHQHRYFAI